MNPDAIAACVSTMRSKRPLVQCMPNVVAAEITANVLLAAGAAPAMVIGIEEAPEFAAKKATALSINCGALTAERLASMFGFMGDAGRAAVPGARWPRDPLACASEHREAPGVLLRLEPSPATLSRNLDGN